MDLTPEAVHTVDDWYDGPRGGAADYRGEPYWYRSVYLDTETWDPDEDRFELTPLTAEALGWIRELAAIFQRWDAQRQAGHVTWDGDEETFGAFADERDRARELNRLIEDYLARTPPTVLVRGTFEPVCTHVRWQLLESL
jgi:hypothetical protein